MPPTSASLKKSPLDSRHRASGAKMAASSGWDLPLEYVGATHEHLAVRQSAGLFDLSHLGELEIAGKDALAAVQMLPGGVAMIGGVVRWTRPGAAFLLVGGAMYLVGTFFVTMRCNVPLNNSLAAVAPGDASDEERWDRYVRRWTAWNHVRTVASLGALGAFAIALIRFG